MIEVRRLDQGDIAGFRAMNALFSEVFGEPESYAEKQPSDDYAASWLSNINNVAILAEEDSEPIGAIGGYILPKFEQERSELYIYDLAVLENHRRKGVASAIIEKTRRVARSAGAWTVYVQADVFPEDEPARLLYRKFANEEILAHQFDIKP